MRSHEIDYQILGEDIQVVEVELDPNETVIAEAGSMLYMEDGIIFETRMGDGSQANQSIMGKLFQAGSRVLMGESLFMTHFTNRGVGKRKVAFAAPYPGTIRAVDLAQINQNTLIVQKDAFLCAAMGTKISIHFNKRFGSGLFGGEGFILERIQGDGMAFIHSGGVVMERQLNNETLRIDTGCVVGFEPQLNFDIQASGGLKSMIFGGEGMFLATLSGTGKVWIQSLPISKLIRRLSPSGGNANKESGSVLGGLADMFES
ncbi:TIGR00266 family protein [Marinilongibacter aquaticus]|uniref:TIGR00266 family protein n=1 Tax=Marinilongibacter aquaticus TaxID=2975157 RepID=UPI0021BDC783|nr:TIGR00266 family protein [Marinilongibacter aquaticus]UBM60626.1 TIGR00266 family protein [Marinilongibacter aquaticus]